MNIIERTIEDLVSRMPINKLSDSQVFILYGNVMATAGLFLAVVLYLGYILTQNSDLLTLGSLQLALCLSFMFISWYLAFDIWRNFERKPK